MCVYWIQCICRAPSQKRAKVWRGNIPSFFGLLRRKAELRRKELLLQGVLQTISRVCVYIYMYIYGAFAEETTRPLVTERVQNTVTCVCVCWCVYVESSFAEETTWHEFLLRGVLQTISCVCVYCKQFHVCVCTYICICTGFFCRRRWLSCSLQHTANDCNTLQHTATVFFCRRSWLSSSKERTALLRGVLQTLSGVCVCIANNFMCVCVYIYMYIYIYIHVEVSSAEETTTTLVTGCRRIIFCLELQNIFRKRATDYRALSRKMTSKDKTSYDSTPLCTGRVANNFMCVCVCIYVYT